MPEELSQLPEPQENSLTFQAISAIRNSRKIKTGSSMWQTLETTALEAGRIILRERKTGASIRMKQDMTPVTQADEKAEALILSVMARDMPDIAVVAEEAVAAGMVPDITSGLFFLVDALDGTREFISGHDDFTVNIALVRNGIPVAGIVVAPAKSVAYVAAGGQCEKLVLDHDLNVIDRRKIAALPPVEKLRSCISRSHNSAATDRFLKDNRIDDISIIGSSLKFCLMAEGKVNVYPRFSRTMEWDTAAGDAVLRAAGGITLTQEGKPLLYGKIKQGLESDFANPHFIAWGGHPPETGILPQN